MKAFDYIAGFLAAQGVSRVFEVVGGMTTHLIDSLYRDGKIKIVSVHHEQAAAFAADATGRLTGVPGVAMATSGPGATNLLTGIGSCYFDSSPAIFITGQVNRSEQKRNRPIRQLGFQETDIVEMARPITKAAWRLDSPDALPSILAEAFTTALSGRPGPVLVDVPMDVQRADVGDPIPARLPALPGPPLDPAAVEELGQVLTRARRPLIVAGGGIRAARAAELFRKFVDVAGIPVVNSLLMVDALPHDHPRRVGMIGSYGNRWVNLAVGRADLLLVLGSRLDIRQTGAETDAFKSGRTIFHVDCDAGEVNNRVTGCRAILSDLKPFLEAAIQLASSRPWGPWSEWYAEIDELKRTWPDTAEIKDVPGINPNRLMHQLSSASHVASAYVSDVGQHQMWAAQSLDLERDQSFLTSGGMGAMGFGLPAAIGAAFAHPSKPVVLVAGDAGFQLNIQELETVVHQRLPVKIVILDNQCQGMVRQFQQSYFHERYPGTMWGYSTPDFVRVANAYGIPACAVNDPTEVDAGLREMWQDPGTPFLLHVRVDSGANAYPKIAFGLPMTEMEPLAKPIDMEGT